MDHFKRVKLDEKSLAFLEPVKAAYEAAYLAMSQLPENKAKDIAAAELDSSYFWVEESVRDNQVWRVGKEAQPEEVK